LRLVNILTVVDIKQVLIQDRPTSPEVVVAMIENKIIVKNRVGDDIVTKEIWDPFVLQLVRSGVFCAEC
jgi:hypothetical protein